MLLRKSELFFSEDIFQRNVLQIKELIKKFILS